MNVCIFSALQTCTSSNCLQINQETTSIPVSQLVKIKQFICLSTLLLTLCQTYLTMQATLMPCVKIPEFPALQAKQRHVGHDAYS